MVGVAWFERVGGGRVAVAVAVVAALAAAVLAAAVLAAAAAFEIHLVVVEGLMC